MNGLGDAEKYQILLVEARDMKMLFDLEEKLRVNKERLSNLESQKAAIMSTTSAYQSQVCPLCCSPYGFFNKPQECTECKSKICKRCINEAVCELCIQKRSYNKRLSDWQTMKFYKRNTFGGRKLEVQMRTDFERKNDIHEFVIRAVLERTVRDMNDPPVDIDKTDVERRLSHKAIREACAELTDTVSSLITELSQSSIGANLALSDATNELKHQILRTRSQFEVEIDKPNDLRWVSCHYTETEFYETLLSIAIINQIIIQCTSTNSVKKPSVSTLNVQLSTESLENLSTVLMRKQRAQLPSLDEVDVDSAFETDDLESMGSRKTNWFFKETTLFPHQGSIRVQSVQPSMKAFLDSIPDSLAAEDTNMIDEPFSNEDKQENQIEAEPLSFVSHPDTVICSAGEKVSFKCQVTGKKPIEISWYDSNSEITDKGKYRVTQKGDIGQLEIYDIESKDSGEIICLAVNDTSVATVVTKLTVTDRDIAGEEPMFIQGLTSKSAEESTDVKFQITVTGYPEPRVTFCKNREVINSCDRYTIDSLGNGSWELRIVSVNLSDSAQITAFAANRMGKVSSRAALAVSQRKTSPTTAQGAKTTLEVPKSMKGIFDGNLLAESDSSSSC